MDGTYKKWRAMQAGWDHVVQALDNRATEFGALPQQNFEEGSDMTEACFKKINLAVGEAEWRQGIVQRRGD